MTKLELKLSDDGSHTLYNKELNENYHSTNGAIQEANHVFIKTGLEPILGTKRSITIVEMGFGTGLNALLTANFAKEMKQQIHYIGIEAYPVDEELISALNYPEILGGDSSKHFKKIHEAKWDGIGLVNNYFTLQKVAKKLEDFEPRKAIDLVYYDAFGPQVQSEVWDINLFDKLFNFMSDKGVFVTYCAKGQVRRDLESVGFKMERLDGPPGKREMLRGTK